MIQISSLVGRQPFTQESENQFMFKVLIMHILKFMHNYSSNYINDASAAMFIVFVCFLIPANPKDLLNSSPLMTWKSVQEKVPWGVFLLMGGAFAMASGIKVYSIGNLFISNKSLFERLPVYHN